MSEHSIAHIDGPPIARWDKTPFRFDAYKYREAAPELRVALALEDIARSLRTLTVLLGAHANAQ